MISLGLVIFTILVLFACTMLAVRGHSVVITSLEQVTAVTRPVDLDAFRNLIDASDEEYLRASLSGSDFRRVERMRMRAAMDYLGRAAHNSAILLRVGENNRNSANPQIAAAGQELANSALNMRMLCIAAMAITLIRIALPQLRLSNSSICDRYAAVRERVITLSRSELPSVASRLDSAL
jgi:hypothetical protein